MDRVAIQSLKETVWDFYRSHGRTDLAWRQPRVSGEFDPYKIMVSEIMLQQTQVVRVRTKYVEFLEHFPTIATLASAELGDVLRVWSGLGYNRRAKFLHRAAQIVVWDFKGRIPRDVNSLMKLPGVGSNTAGAILAYAYNQPVVFIETNIRTVYIHHFFNDQIDIHDKELLKFVSETLDREHPREWYWALMDYGSSLKKVAGNRSKQSKHYAKQSKFVGSKRQIRGQVLRLLGNEALTRRELIKRIGDDRSGIVITDLLNEGLIQKKGSLLTL